MFPPSNGPEMSSFISAAPVASGQVQSLDSLRGHSLPSDAMILASATQVNPTNQNPGSYAIVESGVNSLGVTATGSVPATTLSPFADVYKEGSIYLNGTTGNYLQNTATYSNLSINWATSGLTIEAWVNYPTFVGASFLITTNPVPTLFAFSPPTTTTGVFLGFGANTSGYVNFYYYNPSAGLQTVMGLTQISTNTWNHIAMTCTTSGQIYLFVNGVQTQVVANRSGSLQSASFYETFQGAFTSPPNGIILGQVNSTNTNAYVADLRLTTGTPLYTGSTSSYATFTVPSAPLSSTTSPGVTQFLLRIGQNSPTVQNGALTFDRGLKQFQNYGPMTFNIVTQGFTAIWRGAFTGTPGSYERLFEFGQVNTSTGAAISVMRNATTTNLQFYIFPTTSSTAYFVQTTNFVAQGTTYVVAFRYNPTLQIADVWVNGAWNNQATITTAQLVADRTVPFTYISRASDGAPNGNFSSNTLAIYNRALSNVEIYNSYLALNTVPATPQQKTLEIGDINGTPALSVAGNGQVSVQSIGLSSNVVPWPPAAMTGYVTSINGKNYVASASTEYSSSYLAWYAFDKNSTGTFWISAASYGSTAPYASTAYTTTDVNGTAYLGEWLQIQVPNPVTLSSYSISPGNNAASGQAPAKWAILGSRDGVNWTLVDARAGITTWAATTAQTFSAASSQSSWTYFRCVVSQANGYVGSTPVVVFAEWTLYGTADASPSLTIAPATTFNTSVATPSLTGIAAAGVYVPQDFSSSGLNIPAYVVSNTATVANTVAYSSFGPFAGEGSLYFPGGSRPVVGFPPGTPPNFTLSSTSVCTFEAWIYPTLASGVAGVVFAHSPTTSLAYDWELYVESNGKLGWFPASGGTAVYSTNNVNLNAWNHVAWTFSGGSVYLALNGVVNSASMGTPPYTATYSLCIGSNMYTQFNGYIASARIVSGQALYTTNFQVPSAPLQPIQGTTQAGLPYGTVLLLRNAPAPGRIQTTRLTGSNSGSVLSFPPAAMTGYAVSLNSGYGQGTYVASASSENTAGSGYYSYKAFDKATGNPYSSVGNLYNSSTGVYAGATSNATVDINGSSYIGEWLQIQLPVSIVLSNYQIQSRSDYGNNNGEPKTWWILGSRDGGAWNLVDSRTGVTFGGAGSNIFATVQSYQAFSYYRMVTYVIAAQVGAQNLAIGEWTLNGQIEGLNINPDGRVGLGVVNPTRALEVAGDVVCAGTLSAGNPLMFRNRIINGDVKIDQRNGYSSTTSTTGVSTTFVGDRWNVQNQTQSATAITTQVVSSPGTNPPAGYALKITAPGSTISQTTSTGYGLYQAIEGYNILDFNWGTSYGSPATFSFWVYATNTGTYSFTMRNSASTYTYAGSIGITATNAWQYFTYTIPPPPTGSAWNTTNGPGISLTILLLNASSGSNFATAGSWVSGNKYDGVSGQTNFFATTGNIIHITGVQLEKGLVATTFEVRPYATELALCQRYYQKTYNMGTAPGTSVAGVGAIVVTASSSTIVPGVQFRATMRAAPTIVMYNPYSTTSGVIGIYSNGFDTGAATADVSTIGDSGFRYVAVTVTSGVIYQYHYTANAEL